MFTRLTALSTYAKKLFCVQYRHNEPVCTGACLRLTVGLVFLWILEYYLSKFLYYLLWRSFSSLFAFEAIAGRNVSPRIHAFEPSEKTSPLDSSLFVVSNLELRP